MRCAYERPPSVYTHSERQTVACKRVGDTQFTSKGRTWGDNEERAWKKAATGVILCSSLIPVSPHSAADSKDEGREGTPFQATTVPLEFMPLEAAAEPVENALRQDEPQLGAPAFLDAEEQRIFRETLAAYRDRRVDKDIRTVNFWNSGDVTEEQNESLMEYRHAEATQAEGVAAMKSAGGTTDADSMDGESRNGDSKEDGGEKGQRDEKNTYDLWELAKSSRTFVSRGCTNIMYPDVDENTYFAKNAYDPSKPVPPTSLDERGPHPMDAKTKRYVEPKVFYPMETRRDDDYRYPEFSDHYFKVCISRMRLYVSVCMSTCMYVYLYVYVLCIWQRVDVDVAAYLITPEVWANVTQSILNPPQYPIPVPHDLNLWDIDPPKEGEEYFGLKLSDIEHPYDWYILRRPLEELTLREVDRVVRMVETLHRPHRKREEIHNHLWAQARKRLVTTSQWIEIPRNRQDQQYATKFFMNRYNLVRVFNIKQMADNTKKIAMSLRQQALSIYNPRMVAQAEADLKRVGEMAIEAEQARLDEILRKQREMWDMPTWKRMIMMPLMILRSRTQQAEGL